MTNVLKNGVLSKSAMKRASAFVEYDTVICKLNTMWNHKNYFDICHVTDVAKTLGREYTHSGYKYDFLKPYHVTNWSRIPSETREELAAVVVSYLNNTRIAYHRTEQRFVDLAKTSESDSLFTKYSVSRFYQTLAKLDAGINAFYSKLLNLFKKKKA